jgi:hypothetical protein
MYQESADILRTDKSIIPRAMGVGNIMDVIEDKVVALIGNELQTVSNLYIQWEKEFQKYVVVINTPNCEYCNCIII